MPSSTHGWCSATLQRWNFANFTLEQEDFLTAHPLPLKVMIHNGVLYRFNMDGTLSVEIYPGDGSVFRSEAEHLGKYFKHYFVNKEIGQVEDRLYTVRDLPPDKPRTLYSVRSILSQAKRLLLGSNSRPENNWISSLNC
ncbi:uncharacterized protein C5orf34 homolog isoform X2 [Aquarana catesbeiana]|uniref:uncharacterized protein C5orf34 homolog isoform X2 n=1 Tax=Aquarana catesbeiana TaxID=8400 RepID=UPI003CC98F66